MPSCDSCSCITWLVAAIETTGVERKLHPFGNGGAKTNQAKTSSQRNDQTGRNQFTNCWLNMTSTLSSTDTTTCSSSKTSTALSINSFRSRDIRVAARRVLPNTAISAAISKEVVAMSESVSTAIRLASITSERICRQRIGNRVLQSLAE